MWKLFFDGATRTGPRGNIMAGVGIVLVSPQNYVIPRVFSLTEPCSNNVAEYNTLMIGMQIPMRLALKISKHTVIQSSSLTKFAGSTKSDMKTWYPITNSYSHGREVQNFYIDHVPRQLNAHADALASFAAFLALPARVAEKVLV